MLSAKPHRVLSWLLPVVAAACGAAVDPDPSPTGSPEVPPGVPPGADAATRDAGPTPPVADATTKDADAAPPEGGPDAAPGDAGPADASPDAPVGDAGADASDAGPPPYVTGQTYFDTSGNRWLEYVAGDLPIVLSAPHDGPLEPASVVDRAANPACPPDITTARDTNAATLGRKMQAAFVARYGGRPHLVVANISRKKVDLNRDANGVDEAACGEPRMRQVWAEFHGFIEAAVAAEVARFGHVLYIDVHAHGHTKERLELGYLFSGTALRSFATNPAFTSATVSSLANLPRHRGGLVSTRELLTGAGAFGTLSSERGVPSVPSRVDPAPLVGDPYFNGGYNTERYTGASYPTTFGWQIEANPAARSTDAARTATGTALADSVIAFLFEHHGTFAGASTWSVPPPLP